VRSTLRYAARVRRVLRTEPFDVAYFNQWPYLHVLLAPGAARRRAAIDWCELRGGPLYGAVQRLLPRLVAANFCVNDELAARLSALSGRKVGYLPTGVTTESYEDGAHGDGLLFVGRLVDTKDLPLLIAAYGELCRRGVRLPLRVAGDGSLKPVVDAAVAALPADARAGVTLLGRVSEEEKRRLLGTARVLMVSSRREGFPLVVSEAMASGLPVATVDRPDNGTAHVVRRFGVGAVGAPTPAGLADAVEEALARFEEFSQRGRAGVAELHWDRVVDRFLEEVGCVRR
jgi:glycosyltransferase involved in cell wall biosynthesis